MQDQAPTPGVDRYLFQEAPEPIRRAYRSLVAATSPVMRHKQACALAEASLAFLASIAVSKYRRARDERPVPRVEAILARSGRPTMGAFLELLHACAGAAEEAALDVAGLGATDRHPACDRLAAVMDAIQDAIDMEARNLRRVLERAPAQGEAPLGRAAAWNLLVEYRNKSEGHPLKYSWPVDHPDYHALVTPHVEAALVELLGDGHLRAGFARHLVAEVEEISRDGDDFVHGILLERDGLPARALVRARRSIEEGWPEGLHAGARRRVIVEGRDLATLDLVAPFWDVLRDGLPPARVPAPAAASRKPLTAPRRHLAGRDGEMRRITALLDRVADHGPEGERSAVLLVGGESGVGKSSTCRATCESARERGFDVAEVACEPFHEGMSLFPMFEVIRQLFGGATPLQAVTAIHGAGSSQVATARLAEDLGADAGARREALFATFVNAIQGRFLQAGKAGRPVLIFIDDLERIDAGTADALLCLIARLREAPLLLAGAYRTDLLRDDEGRKHPLRAVMLAARRLEDAHAHLVLGSVSRDDLPAMVQSMLGGRCSFPSPFFSRLFQETEGNPLFVREILRLLSSESRPRESGRIERTGETWTLTGDVARWDIPASVEEAIAARLGFLDREQRQELEKAAVIGRRFAFAVMCELTATSEDELLEHLERFLSFDIIHELDEGDDTFEFSHGKMRDVLYQSMSGLRRKRLHSQVADVLVSLRGSRGDDWDAMIGEHLFQSGRLREACPWLLKAARASWRMHAMADAANQLLKAVTSGDREGYPEGEERMRVRLEQAEALKLASELDAAGAIFAELSASSVPDDIRGWAHNHLGDVALLRGDVSAALAHYEKSEAAARATGDDRHLLEVVADLTELHDRQAERLAGTDPDAAARHREKALQYLATELELAESSTDGPARSRALRNKAKRLRAQGEIDAALECYEQAVSLDDSRVASHRILIPYAKALRLAGRDAEAMRQVERVLAWSVQAGIRRSEAIARQYRGLLRFEAARRSSSPEEADLASLSRAELEQALKLHEETGFDLGRRETEIHLAEWHLAFGEEAEAWGHLARALGASMPPAELLRAAAAQLEANGEQARAKQLVERAGK